jgi:glycine cleavage system transcriptional repressor
MISNRLISQSSLKLKNAIRTFSSIDKQYLVVNAVGTDRPGIVSDVTKVVVNQGGSIGASRAAKLGSHFGLMMLVSVPKNNTNSLKDILASLNSISVTCFETGDPKAVEVTPMVGYSGQFVLSGADHPGIVHKVTELLAKHRLNIDELETFEEEAPFGGTTLFHMTGVATSPAPLAKGFDANVIREELEDLGDELNCDITLEHIHDDKDCASFYAG